MTYWVLKSTAAGPLEARHRWYLPGMRCTVCGRVWAAGGVALPTVDIEQSPVDARLRMEPYPVPLDEWRQLAAHVRPFVPQEERVRPGLELGPLEGRSHYAFRMAWYLSSIVISEDLREELQALAPQIPLVRANLSGENLAPSYELEIRSHGAELRAQVTEHCEACGYSKSAFPEDRKDLCVRNVPDVPLFRPRNWGLTIAHDRVLRFFERELGSKLEMSPIQVELT